MRGKRPKGARTGTGWPAWPPAVVKAEQTPSCGPWAVQGPDRCLIEGSEKGEKCELVLSKFKEKNLLKKESTRGHQTIGYNAARKCPAPLHYISELPPRALHARGTRHALQSSFIRRPAVKNGAICPVFSLLLTLHFQVLCRLIAN